MRQVEFFRRRVREGVFVEDCQDFARYIRMSGIIDLMRDNPHKGENPGHTERLQRLFPYNASELYEAVRLLEGECCDYWQGKTKDSPGTASGASKSDLEAIDSKLNLIAGVLSNLVSVERRSVAEPCLRVLDRQDDGFRVNDSL
jgi:hypothetical protein